jgi:nucleotide-binding universal stress UspA family protein
MFKTIVVPVDPGHAARSSAMIAVARQLGGDDAKIVLMSVVEDIPTYVAAELPGGFTDKAKNNARAELERLAQENQLNAEIVVRSGQPSAGILGTAKEKQADVIVIASHKPDLSDYLLGSTAARVVRHAKCPVFVLR